MAYATMEFSTYSAKAVLLVSANHPKILFNTNEIKTDFAAIQRQTLTMIKTRTVLSAALSDSELVKLRVGLGEPDPVAWLKSQIKVKLSGEFLEIEMSGADPELLPKVVNAVANAYLTEVGNYDYNERQKRASGSRCTNWHCPRVAMIKRH